jgi:hypothetical protein
MSDSSSEASVPKIWLAAVWQAGAQRGRSG